MSRSNRVDSKYIPKVKLALQRNGYPSQRKFAEDVDPCLSTVKNFLNGKPVDYENFREICERLGLDWQEIVHRGVNVEPNEQVAKLYQELGEAVEPSGSDVNSDRGVDNSQLLELLEARIQNIVEVRMQKLDKIDGGVF
jgi:DNA polymerase/3'-5' exonuclease PolX